MTSEKTENKNEKVIAPAPPDARWYIVHTYSGQEERVNKNLDQRIQTLDMQHKIFQVIVPKEEVIEIKEGKREKKQKNLFPGYILVQMIMDDESWFAVRNTPGVTGFVSSDEETKERRHKPVPLEPKEVESILKRVQEGAPQFKVGFRTGESVRITSEPFTDFIGTVNSVDPDKGRIKVLVSFFGRETEVELDLLQVERI